MDKLSFSIISTLGSSPLWLEQDLLSELITLFRFEEDNPSFTPFTLFLLEGKDFVSEEYK